MKYFLTIGIILSLSTPAFSGTCVDKYQKIVKDNKRGAKENIGDAMLVGALSSTVAIVSFGTGGPGLMLTGLASFAASGYMGGSERENRQEALGVLNLIKDAKVKNGYYLRDATRMIQQHFQDSTITEEEVAEHVLKQDSAMAFCSGEKLQGLSGVLMRVGKSIIVSHGTVDGKGISNIQRGMVEKNSSSSSSETKPSSSAVEK